MRGTGPCVPMVVAVLCVAFGVHAQDPNAQPARVAVDWAGVGDADVERCGLSRLRAGTIERLVADGHAVVETTDASGVRVTVASAQEGLRVRVESSAASRDELLHAGTPCDATFALEAISRIAELVGEVARATAAATAASPGRTEPNRTHDSPHEATPAVAAVDDPSGVRFQGDLGVRLNVAPDYQMVVGFALRARARSGWELGARTELAVQRQDGVSVFEPFLGLVVAYLPGRALLGPYLELGPLVHVARSDERSVTKLDATLGAGVQLELGHFLAQLLAYGRLRSLEHRVGSARAFETGHFGLAVRIGAQTRP